jgi:hypothetical protein
MSNYKGPTEGGSGGKRGHSNMEHWVTTAEIKESTKSLRRKDDDEEVVSEMDSHRNASNQFTFDFIKIEYKLYSSITNDVVAKFEMEPATELVTGLNEKFQEFKSGSAVIGLEWDNWSGYIVSAKNVEAEQLAEKIANFINEKYQRA